MTMFEQGLPAVTGHVDADGRLTRADARLADLNRRAGGAIGEPLAIPELARFARLAARLGIDIARRIVVGDAVGDIELLARAVPGDTGVALELGGWTETAEWHRELDDAASDAAFLAVSGDWRWETDGALRITRLSARAGTVAGFDVGGFLGRPLTDLFRLTDDSEHGLPILSAVASGARVDGQSAELRENGRAVTLSAVSRADAAGRFSGLIGSVTMVDTDTPEDVPAALTPAFARRLERALRDPLRRIIANADSIQAQAEGPLRSDYAGYAADIASAGRHLLGLVTDLEDLQAIERADFTTQREAVDLADIARRAAGLLGVRAADADIRIDGPGDDETMPGIGEFRRALQVMVNLIGNAVRYSPSGATVWIRLERDGDTACAIVADQGKGIATENHERIFEKFERLEPGETEGSGLGLYISRRLARAMGGDLRVDSAPGEGARFVFLLPARH